MTAVSTRCIIPPIILRRCKMIGWEPKERGRTRCRRVKTGRGRPVVANGAAEEAASRTFAHQPGEGEALWWVGLLATIKATAEETGGRSTLVEMLRPPMARGTCCTVHHQEDEGFWILEEEVAAT